LHVLIYIKIIFFELTLNLHRRKVTIPVLFQDSEYGGPQSFVVTIFLLHNHATWPYVFFFTVINERGLPASLLTHERRAAGAPIPEEIEQMRQCGKSYFEAGLPCRRHAKARTDLRVRRAPTCGPPWSITSMTKQSSDGRDSLAAALYRACELDRQENSKGERLQTALKRGLAEAKKKGGAERAIIFTESTRTQEYVRSILEAIPHYKGKIVLFNGSNNDAKSKEIYQSRLKKHATV
jgi:hypothetical protein